MIIFFISFTDRVYYFCGKEVLCKINTKKITETLLILFPPQTRIVYHQLAERAIHSFIDRTMVLCHWRVAALLVLHMVSTRRKSFGAKDPPAGLSSISVLPEPVATNASNKEAVTIDQVPVLERRATRSAPTPIIRCSDFGPLRNQIYPGASFCSECVWWEAQLASGTMGRAKRTSKTFECKYVQSTKKHKSFIFPYPYDPSQQQDIPKAPPVIAQPKKRAAVLKAASKKEKYT
jgi:hypothetical protein